MARLAIAACFILVLAAGTPARADLWDTVGDDLTWSGYLKNETAWRIHEPRTITKIRNTLALSGNYRLGEHFEVAAMGWYYYDLAYDLFDYKSISARPERDIQQPLAFIENLEEEKDSNVLDIRELYLDISFDTLDIRLGRQFVIWGVLTGVRVVDEINPMDFRELVLPDLLDYRIPLWMARFDYYAADNAFQFLWIPNLVFHRPAPRGSEWELLQDVITQDGVLLTDYPESSLDNSEYAFRVSRTVMNTEISLSYFNTWDDFPVVFRRVPVDATVGAAEPEFFPTYMRIQMYGLTFQRPLLGQVIKGEFAYVQDKYFGIDTIDRDGDGFLDNNGELQRDHIRWGLGFDFNLKRTDYSIGITQWVILDYADEIIQDEFDTAFNIFIRREIPDRRTVLSLLGIVLFNQSEGYLKPKVTFDASDRVQIGVGMDLFWGAPSQFGVAFEGGRPTNLVEIEQRSQFFGNFKHNNRLFVEFKYAF